MTSLQQTMADVPADNVIDLDHGALEDMHAERKERIRPVYDLPSNGNMRKRRASHGMATENRLKMSQQATTRNRRWSLMPSDDPKQRAVLATFAESLIEEETPRYGMDQDAGIEMTLLNHSHEKASEHTMKRISQMSATDLDRVDLDARLMASKSWWVQNRVLVYALVGVVVWQIIGTAPRRAASSPTCVVYGAGRTFARF